MLATDAALLFTQQGQVWRWDGRKADPWRAWPDALGRAKSLAAGANGVWLSGSAGLGYLRQGSAQPEFILAGIWVQAVQPVGERLWVASWKQGLLLRENGQWFRYGRWQGLKTNAVMGLALDGDDRLWLGLYGGGGWYAMEADMAAVMHRYPWQPEPDPE